LSVQQVKGISNDVLLKIHLLMAI